MQCISFNLSSRFSQIYLHINILIGSNKRKDRGKRRKEREKGGRDEVRQGEKGRGQKYIVPFSEHLPFANFVANVEIEK